MKNRIASIASSLAILGLVASAGVIVGASESNAQGCCADYARDTTVKSESKEVVSQLSERINAMQLAIIEAMRLGAGQQSANSKENIASTSNIAGVQDDRNTVGRAESAIFAATRESANAPSTCGMVTMARAGSTVSGASAETVKLLASEYVSRNLGEGSSGIEEARSQRLKAHCDRFASADDVDSGLCPSYGEMPNADINVAQSVYHTSVGSDVRGLDNDRLEAGSLFISNSIDPIPQGPMLAGEASTAEGKIKAAARMASASRISVAMDAALDILARRQKTTEGADAVAAKAATIDGYRGDLSKGYSDMDYMEVMSRSWHFSSKQNTTIGGMGMSEAMKELVLIQGFQTYQNFKTYEQVEKQTMILAQMLAIMAEQARPDRVASR